jgi:hypothetical protein
LVRSVELLEMKECLSLSVAAWWGCFLYMEVSINGGLGWEGGWCKNK